MLPFTVYDTCDIKLERGAAGCRSRGGTNFPVCMARLCDSTLRNIQPSGFSGCYSIMRTRGGRVYMYSIYVQISVGVKSVQIAVMGVQ